MSSLPMELYAFELLMFFILLILALGGVSFHG